MPKSALTIANYFIDKGIQEGRLVSPMKLQKLVYIAHGWYLALNNEPLVRETVYAWKFGPVIEDLYRDFRKFGAGEITELVAKPGLNTFPDDEYTKEFLDNIWQAYGKHHGYYLSALTHKKDTPWSQVYDENRRDTVIPTEIIKEHYQKLAMEKGLDVIPS